MRKYDLEFEDIDVFNDRANYDEMGAQVRAAAVPCVEIDGIMLADVSGEEVENLPSCQRPRSKPNDARAEEPINVGCAGRGE